LGNGLGGCIAVSSLLLCSVIYSLVQSHFAECQIAGPYKTRIGAHRHIGAYRGASWLATLRNLLLKRNNQSFWPGVVRCCPMQSDVWCG